MFFKVSILVLSSVVGISRCSLVIDGLSHNALYVSDYCPNMQYCSEGSHVMCMYYNPRSTMGPRCSNPQNVSVTPDLAAKLLDVSNAVRSKIALGKEKGKNGEYLPRAYGMFRLKWDSELATFAQVLANQCVLRHDMCRATKRFPDPGQTAGLVRFTFPDWYPVSRPGHFNTAGLSPAKIMYAVMQTLKSWYEQKNSVTENMLMNYPDWTLNPTSQGGRLYMEMIFASATHMGCGISAYTEYAYYDNHAALNYNSIQVICNYSARPRKGIKVFDTSPPVGPGFTVQCGCPIGSREDMDCLCNEYDRIDSSPAKSIGHACNDENCEPNMVLLPIFTVEDAPPQKLIPNTINNQDPLNTMLRKRMDNNTLEFSQKSQEIFDFFSEAENQQRTYNNIMKTVLNVPVSHSEPRLGQSRQKEMNRNNVDVSNRYYDANSLTQSQLMKNLQAQRPPRKLTTNKKSSIFTRVAKFQLPTNKISGNNEMMDIGIRKDVAPRKDFSNVQNLVNSYLKKRRTDDKTFIQTNTRKHEGIFSKHYPNFEEDFTTETILNRAEEKVMSYDHHLKSNYNNTEDYRIFSNRVNDEAENKLMSLLDTLEREVKHINLDGTEKEIFDVKLRKIYGSVVGKPVELLTQKQHKLMETDTDVENELLELTHFTDDDKHEGISLINDIRRRDNHMIDDARKVDTHYNDKRTNVLKKFEELDNKRSRPTKIRNDDDFNKYIRDYKHNNKLSSDEEIKTRKYDLQRVYKTNFDDTRRRGTDDKAKTYYEHKNNEDPLSAERRKYYQEKLENLERRLHDARSYKRRTEHGAERQMRRMRPNREDMQIRPSRSKSQIDAFYMPDRARYLHGFK